MRLRILAAAVIAALSGTMTGSAASAADDDMSRGQDPVTIEPRVPPDLGNRNLIRSVPTGGKSFEEILAELNRPLTPEEMAAAVRESERNSSDVHFYPDDPEDPRTEPPPLNDKGEE